MTPAAIFSRCFEPVIQVQL